MSGATKEERIRTTLLDAYVMIGACEGGAIIYRRAKTPWNNNRQNYKYTRLTRIPATWNWTKFDYKVGH